MSWAVVTGASRGLGAATALALARDGFDVVLTFATRESEASAVADQIAALGSRSSVYQVDLSDLAAVEAFADQVRSQCTPQVLVNNAGEVFPERLGEVTTAAAERLLRVNTLAPLVLTRELAPSLSSHEGGGAVVNVSSIVAAGGGQGSAVYATSKSALHGMTLTLAVELAPHVRVNAVLPGVFDTDMNSEKLAIPAIAAAAAEMIPLGRVGRPEECAELTAFLLSERARYVTGALIPVDGGVLARLALP